MSGRRISWVLVAISPIALTAIAMGKDAVNRRPVTRVAAEQSVNGITTQVYYDRLADRHRLVTGLMPEGTLTNRIGIELTQNEQGELQRVVPVAGQPLRIGTVKALPMGLTVSGIVPQAQNARVAGGSFRFTADGGFSWAISVGSKDAHAIRVHVKNFSLPVNAEMFFFDTVDEAYGPYTGLGRNGTGEFWTDSIRSDSGVILIRQIGPATPDELASISFTIDRIGHIGNGHPAPDPRGHSWTHGGDMCGFNGNPPCVEDANCGSVAPANQSAIAKMEWIKGAFIFTCTGGAIADTDGSTQRNLFLTANHCLKGAKDAAALETFFEYTTSSCEGDCPEEFPPPHTSGATILATGRDGDFTLLELNQDPPAGTTFLGWNNSPIAFTNGAALARVSNPNYGPQVFSTHDVDTGAGTCNSLPRGEFIYSMDTFGGTDGGSSGSPVVNSSGEIVGQLFGACGTNVNDPCDSGSNATVDGALAFYYDDVAEFLDPQGGGCSSDAECDDGDPCNGAETCVGGSCQAGNPPPCQNGDGCCPSGCTPANDDDCSSCAGHNAPCNDNADCCSGTCRSNGKCSKP